MPFCSKMRTCAKCIILASTDTDEESELVKASLTCPINPVITKTVHPKRASQLIFLAQ